MTCQVQHALSMLKDTVIGQVGPPYQLMASSARTRLIPEGSPPRAYHVESQQCPQALPLQPHTASQSSLCPATMLFTPNNYRRRDVYVCYTGWEVAALQVASGL
jgi:hypothetical protein